jgi:hypothetical protein
MSAALLSPRIYTLGSGTCRIDASLGQTSACIIEGETTFIIDLGFGALERLERVGAFDSCAELHIHISHRHTDHLIGIFPLLQCLAWSDDYRYLSVRRVVIHATEEVCKLIEDVRAVWGVEESTLVNLFRSSAGRSFEYQPGPDYQDWSYSVGSMLISAIHLPGSNNHGALCEIDGKRFGFTGDATEVNEDLITFCKRSDFCVFDFGHVTNVSESDGTQRIDLQQVVELLAKANPPQARAAHVYLRHWQHRPVSQAERATEIARLIAEAGELAKRRGFTGQLALAHDCEKVTFS